MTRWIATCARWRALVLLPLLMAVAIPGTGESVSGTVEVLHGLAKQLFTAGGAPSFLAAVPFEIGSQDDPTEAGRRALATTYTTATPNFVVLGLVNEQGLMLYHQIIPGDVLTMTRRLGARP